MGRSSLKVVFFSVNIIYAIIALAVAGWTIFYSLKVKEVTDLRNQEQFHLDWNVRLPQLLPYIFTPIALVATLVVCCGCCGVNNKGALIIYNIFAVLVMLFAIGAGVALVMMAMEPSKVFVKETLTHVFDETTRLHEKAEKFKQFEISLNCCGADGAANYQNAFRVVPPHCCSSGRDCSSLIGRKLGCITVANKLTEWSFYGMSAGCIAVAFFSLISMVLSCILMRNMNGKLES